jgi:DNA polymerase I-like protein with 3'-5' exonuclease and polymerase domains
MKVIYVASKETFMETIEDIFNSDSIGFDIEANGLNPRLNDLLLIQIGTGKINYVYDVTKLPEDKTKYLVEVIKDKLIVGFNLKFDLQFIYEKYEVMYTNIYDIMIAEKVITAGIGKRYPSLADVVSKYFDVEINKETRKLFEEFNGEMSPLMIEYAATDVHYLLAMMSIQEEVIESHKLGRTINLEMKLLPAVSDMELNGMLLNVEEWNKLTRHAKRFTRRLGAIVDSRFEAELRNFLDEYPEINASQTLKRFSITRNKDVELEWKRNTGFEKHAYRIAYNNMLKEVTDPDSIVEIFFLHFNPNSHKQKKAMLNFMGIVTESIDQKVLKRDFPTNRFVRTMIRYGEEFKKAYTYGDNMLQHIDETTGRIHANFDQMGTTTGRFSSSKPNLQNQISDAKYRKCYIAKNDSSIITADYSQIELRVLCDITGEEKMIEAYKNNKDIHRQTAALIFGVPERIINKNQRFIGKGTNFGIVYGATEKGIAYNFSMSEAQAREIIRRMKLAYPVLASYMSRAHDEVIKRAFSTTPLGRKRFFRITEFIRSPHGTTERLSIQRQGFNHIVQGCAADIMKIALVNLWYENPFGKKFKLLATVHDEVVIEISNEIKEEAVEFVDKMMVTAGETFLSKVPVLVDKTVEPYWIK